MECTQLCPSDQLSYTTEQTKRFTKRLLDRASNQKVSLTAALYTFIRGEEFPGLLTSDVPELSQNKKKCGCVMLGAAELGFK